MMLSAQGDHAAAYHGVAGYVCAAALFVSAADKMDHTVFFLPHQPAS